MKISVSQLDHVNNAEFGMCKCQQNIHSWRTTRHLQPHLPKTKHLLFQNYPSFSLALLSWG